MSRLKRFSIRSLLLLITFVVALPAAGIIIYTGIRSRSENLQDAFNQTAKLAERIATEQQNLVVGAEQLMSALSQLPEVRQRNTARVEPILRELRKLNPMYSNIFIADLDGVVWATAVAVPPPFVVADRRYFKNALASGHLSSGEYVVSRATAKPAFNVSAPLKDEHGATIGVISVGFVIDNYRELFKNTPMLAGSSYVLLDHRGTVLSRAVNPEQYIGKPYPEREFRKMQDGPESGSEIRTGIIGDLRVISYRWLQLSGEKSPYFYVSVGIPVEVITREANRTIIRNMALLSSFLVVACAAAMFIGKYSIVNRIKALEDASQRLAAGDLQVRVSGLVAGGELGNLARVFDIMAEELARREAEQKEMEEVLRINEERIRQAITVSNLGIFDHNHLANTIYWSPRQRAIHGWGPDEPVNLSDFINLVHPDDVDYITAAIRKAHDPSGDGLWEVEHRIRRRDGTIRWLTERSQTFFDGAGDARHPVRTVGAVRDITEEKAAESALKHSRDLLNETQKLAHLGSWEFDLVSNELTWSDEIFRIFEIDPEKFAATYEAFLQAVHPEDRELVDTVYRRSVRERTPYAITHRLLMADGRIKIVEERGETLYQDGNAVRSIGSVQDITARRQGEEGLAASHKLLQTIIDTVPLRVFWKDTELCYIGCNNAFARDTGCDRPEDVVGKDDHQLAWKELAGLYQADDRRVIASGIPTLSYEEPLTTPDGAQRWVRTSKVPLRNSKNEIFGILGVYEDITDLKAAEAEKNLLAEQLIQAQKMESIGRLAGGVAHDFNNLLTPIIGYSQMLQRELADREEARAMVASILDAADKSRILVQQLLSFSRKQVLEMKVIDFNQVIGDFQRILRHTIRENIDLRIHLTEKPYGVRADRNQIEQVIMNLAVNAQDAIAGHGAITIETAQVTLDDEYARLHQNLSPGRYLMLGVSDDGCGMDQETRQRIFEPFFTTKGIGKGTGLGLATVYGIVKQHGGHIWVYSEPGKGTTFKCYFPIAEGLPAGEEIEEQERLTFSGDQRTILLVEDNEMVRTLVGKLLQAQGFEVLIAEEPKEALKISKGRSLDLLITDVVMPNMTGPELHTELLNNYPGLKVLYMSGYTSNIIVHQGILDEGINLIQKPFSITDFTRTLEKVLRS